MVKRKQKTQPATKKPRPATKPEPVHFELDEKAYDRSAKRVMASIAELNAALNEANQGAEMRVFIGQANAVGGAAADWRASAAGQETPWERANEYAELADKLEVWAPTTKFPLIERHKIIAALRLMAESYGPSPHPIETLWRKCGLPEWFLGNGGTNVKLYELYDAIRSFSPAPSKD